MNIATDPSRADTVLPTMYDWVKRTREDVFAYTETLPNEVYLREHSEFPYGSIRDLHAHIAHAYVWWIGRYGLGLEPYQSQLKTLPPGDVATPSALRATLVTLQDAETLSFADVAAMRKKFLEVDSILEKAFQTFDKLDEPLEVIRPGRDQLMVTQRWLIVRPITHEFHHGGQLLMLGRALGHPLPEDMGTDLVLP
jgi:uncharacterized damage-inducible protein DinB